MSDVFNRITDLSQQKRELLARLLKARGVDPATLPIPPRPGDRSRAELSFAQQRLWFLHQLEPGSSFYNVYAVVRLAGPLAVDALSRAMHAIVQRHEILRTIFPLIDGQAVQAILPEATVALTVVELLDPGALMQTVHDEIRQPFDPSRTPPLRARLLRLNQQDHVLILTLHHIITDGWAMKLFIRELTLFYHAFTTGQAAALAPLPIQYADYAAWQRGWMQGQVLADQLAYWREQLANLPTVDLPTDHPRPVVQTFRGARRTFAVPRATGARIAALAQSEGATLFMALLAAFDVLLQRYSSQDDIVVGSPIAGRQRAEAINLIGCFINTLILRVDLSGNPPFRELLGRVRQSCLGAYAHQDLPFEQLVEALHPARDLSHNPLFQIMFILQDNPTSDGPQSEIALEALTIESETTLFDLTLSFTDTPTGLIGALEYNTDLFDATTAERLIGHLLLLLEHCSANPDRPIATLPLLTTAEQQQILIDWNRTATAYPQTALPQLVAAQAAHTPDAIAVVDGERALTYAELDRRSNQLAQHLLGLGVQSETCVAVCLERSPELVIAVLAVLKAGAAYVPLDPAYPAERLQFMLADTGAPVLLTQARLHEQIPLRPSQVLCLDTDWERIAREPAHMPAVAIDLDQLAYVIYTSGSTGQPKGVAMPQGPLLNLVRWQLEHFALPGSARTLQFAPLSFDVSFQELMTTLCGGGTLILIDHERRRDSVALLQHIDTLAVERIFLPFVALQALAEAAQAAQLIPRCLREIISAGEQLQLTDAIKRFVQALDGCVLTNHYGPSETHVVSTFPLSGAPEIWPALPPIGHPIQNARLYLLDRFLQPVPVGVPGELFIGGECLARGYINRPDLTAQRFLPDPFTAQPGSRLYRTGDIGRFLPNGAIAFLGRSDQQIKLRGFRIEPGEIEALLRQAPGVHDAAVVAQGNAQGLTRLVAYVVGEQRNKEQGNKEQGETEIPPRLPQWERGVGGEGLRHFLATRLPDYMIPAAFVRLDALPLTPSGKLDRRALPLPEWTAGPSGTGAAPRTPDEELLAGIWSDVLHITAPGIHDNFFDLGGHSLLAMQVATRVRALFQVPLPLRQMFESPTIAGLARYLAATRSGDQPRQAPPLTPVERPRLIPLSFAQQRLWFMSQLQPDSAYYTIPAVLRLDGPLDPAVLVRAFQTVAQRHEVLRTTFEIRDGQPHQVIAPELAIDVPQIDLRDVPPTAREAAARRWAADAIARPFDLARGPLWRAGLLRIDDRAHLLVLTLHHILADGWSLGLLIGELTTLYSADRSGAAALPSLPIQYADYAIWQRGWMQGDVLTAQLDYWRQQLSGAPPLLELPTDRPRPAIQSFRGAAHEVRLPESLVAGLRAVSRQAGCTLFMTLLAGFQVLLARYSGQRDMLVGTPIAGRTQAATETLIGCFINTLVLRADLSGNPTFRELLAQVRERCLGAYAHQDLPFEQLVEALAVRRDLSTTPLVQVMFALHNLPETQITLDDLTIRSLPLDNPTVKVDLTLSLHETPGGLAGVFEYNSDLFDAATIAQMTAHLLALLTAIVDNPAQRVAQLPLLADTERQLILETWNTTRTSESPSRTLPELFAAQAARTPDAIAVRIDTSDDAADSLSYAVLEARSNQLARYLRAPGVTGCPFAEARVGLCLSRSVDLVVAALAVLKAGGAYVPLDPTYPRERLQYMLRDAGVAVLLTEARLAEIVAADDVPLICVDTDRDRIHAQPASPLPPPDLDQLAYVIYTSGSTGQPKGVQIEHRALANFLLAMARQPGLNAQDTLLAVTTLAFDIAGLELWLPLIVGAQLVLAPREVAGDGALLAERIASSGATIVQATPATWQLLLHSDWRGSDRLTILCGGESLPRDLADQLLARCAALWNLYGPTETTIWSTIQQLAAGDEPISIGHPIANTQTYVLDQHMQPVPIGVAGELYLGGLGLARGYRNRPELTAERFVPDPFGDSGSRLYRTGDRARYRRDGSILLLGRIDRQVKLHGHRIELEEIEATLLQHPAVAAAAVIVREDHAGDRRLVAYVVGEQGNKGTKEQRTENKEQNPEPRTQNLEPGSNIPPRLPQRERGLGGEGPGSTLRSFLRERLPSFMLPSAFVVLDALPRTPNGKLDRRALPRPEQQAPTDHAAYVAPTSELERTIAGLWQELLHLERVGVHDNFFDLGGDSFRMAELHSRLRERIPQRLLLIELFEHPTIHLLARHLSRSASQTAAAPDRSAEKLAAGKQRMSRQLQQRRAAPQPPDPAQTSRPTEDQ